jgi:2-polyprenyl-3-methyl-5-hydroxy-6-metoxy-1,4-benzoquinol methylase
MLAPRNMPVEFHHWNRTQRAPSGSRWWDRIVHSRLRPLVWDRRMRLPTALIRAIGPFGFQANNLTREFEYPWCCLATPLKPGMKVIDLGAGAAGLQFVLSRLGMEVYSVDPLVNPDESVEWTFTDADYERLNRVLGCNVVFVRKMLEEAALPAGSFDRVFAVSVIEHIPEDAASRLLVEVARLLKPGGCMVATIDLFLELKPFTERASNEYGTNVSVKRLIDASGLELVKGDPSELNGFPEFKASEVLARRERYFVGNDVAAQCIVLRKRPSEVA